ncbi:NUDIX hydrolase [Candidatus Bathyarchaeota archaeon]|nr:MAG: NUDIX hydrolase [Candidatus Bathyarchaeota archaeon]
MKKTPTLASSTLIEQNGKILLIKRKYEPGTGKWALPGGLVEFGETVEEAAIREAKEETGLNIKIKKLLGVYNLITRIKSTKSERQYAIVCFQCVPKSFKLRPNHEVADIGWFKPETIKKLPLVSTTYLALKDAGWL